MANPACPCPPGIACPPGGCCLPWPVACNCLPPGWDCDNLTPDQQDAIAAASHYLRIWSGGWYGQCQVTVRPCAPSNDRCKGVCGCSPICRVRLDIPATGVCRVHVDGVEVPLDAFSIDRHLFLVREDGLCFPRCQDLSAPDGSPGTWSVTFLRGWPVGREVGPAVASLAGHIYDQCGGDNGECPLPENVTRVVRTGVSFDLGDEDQALRIPVVRRWLAGVNPGGRRAPLQFISPDEPMRMYTTWSGRNVQ